MNQNMDPFFDLNKLLQRKNPNFKLLNSINIEDWAPKPDKSLDENANSSPRKSQGLRRSVTRAGKLLLIEGDDEAEEEDEVVNQMKLEQEENDKKLKLKIQKARQEA